MPAARPQRGKVRVIGGSLRGRTVDFVQTEQVRPSPDRVRETLFNWLQPVTGGARCLDLFAGSGILGIEALSRGALQVVCVDQSDSVTRHVRQEAQRLDLAGLEVISADVCEFLRTCRDRYPENFDIAFVDPPYHGDLLEPVFTLLEQGHWLRPGGRIYFEAGSEVTPESLPGNWELLKARKAGQVFYHLAMAGDPG